MRLKILEKAALVGLGIGGVISSLSNIGVWQDFHQDSQQKVIFHEPPEEKRNCCFCDPIDPATLPVYNLPVQQADVYCIDMKGDMYGGPEIHADSGEKLFVHYDEDEEQNPNGGYDLSNNRPDRLPLTCSDFGATEPLTLAVCPSNFITGDENSLSDGTGCLSVGIPDAVFTYHHGETPGYITDGTVYPPMVKGAPMRVVGRESGHTR